MSVNENTRKRLSWKFFSGEAVSDSAFLEEIEQLPIAQLLPCLIRLIQYGDAGGIVNYNKLDDHVDDIFPTEIARQIAKWLSQEESRIFFSRWQLLLAIKLICAFGYQGADEVEVTDAQFLKLLLVINDFYLKETSETATKEDPCESLKSAVLGNYSLPPREDPLMLIGRYSELFGRLAAPANQGDFDSWVDIQKVMVDKLDVQLDTFKAVLFALYASTIDISSQSDGGWILPQLGSLNPLEWFDNTELPAEGVCRILELISTSPDQVREKHRSQYGDRVGNPNDLMIFLRYPALRLSDDCLAGVSGQLLIQRYTSGLYWDIHDALCNDKNEDPNRGQFQTFFGELHECYGRDTLQRIKKYQVKRRKKISLLFEEDYKSEDGQNPDSLLIERIGNSKTRCTLFEFKVGRPRYKDSIVEGNVQAFEADLRKKIGAGLDQEINFYQQVQSGERSIPGLEKGDITSWFFVIVVTDPFPSMDMFLKPLREELAQVPFIGGEKRYGPFVLSLSELEQLGTLTKKRISESFITWCNDGSEYEWTFNNFYMNRTKGRTVTNSYVAKLADDDMRKSLTPVFGVLPSELAER